MTVPAGVKPPAPDELAGAGQVHAVDGDSSAVCSASITLEAVSGHEWAEVPHEQRCVTCEVIMNAGTDSRDGLIPSIRADLVDDRLSNVAQLPVRLL
jgi:hypothetical protein